MMDVNALAKVKQDIDETQLEDLLQPGAIWTTGFHPCSILAQVMHYNKEEKLVYCIQHTNYGYKATLPEKYELNQFLRDFAFVGIKE